MRYFPRVDVEVVVEEVVVACAGCQWMKTRANTWMRLREALRDAHFLFKRIFQNLRIKEKVEKKPALSGFRFADIMLHKVFRKSLILCVLSVCLAEVPWQG